MTTENPGHLEKLADEIAHDLVDPPPDFGDCDDGGEALRRVVIAAVAALACLKSGGTVDDARSAAAEALSDLDSLPRSGDGA